ncbi:MAG: 16S rRNA (adenine(1518)-N(6)/adenine(1519)-N(6))-dimethyltransferase RsmA [Leptolyngbyaceae cyanobacterium SL_7_1]|nr:16S rRNA (adenine(1518)-N(6)/adenine(1519)-N(6))-dimethyltransferase RsmA [Leptolyngbyaceae cyanobacterium SL_7_1]
MPPRKQFGQHWLRSDRALQQIIAAADLQPGDCVLEIGAGTGILTERLLPLAPVVAVEIDRDLSKALVQKFRSAENLLILEGDILSLNLEPYLAQFPFRRPNKVVANIPYYITGAILELLLGSIAHPNPTPFTSLVLLVQKEVGDRLCAKPGNRTFGALSVRVQYLATCEPICFVPAKAFYPPPKVDSVVVRLQPRSFSPTVDNPHKLETLVKLGFSSKRKMLHNNLKSLLDSAELMAILENLGINPQARAEELGVADWVALSNTSDIRLEDSSAVETLETAE